MRLRGFRRDLRPRAGRNPQGCDVIEQARIIQPISRPAGLDRLLGELAVALLVKNLIASRRAPGPSRESQRRDDVNIEQHVGKAVAAEMRRQSLKAALI